MAKDETKPAAKTVTANVVYSTLASDMRYTNHGAGGGDLPVATSEVFIAGGAGVMGAREITPMGVATYVTDEQLASLRENAVFKMHEDAGYIIVSNEKVDPEKMASNMNSQDPSRPLNETELTRGPTSTSNPDGSIATLVQNPGAKS